MALSYCWGGPQKFTTNLDSLDSMISGISASQLPRTILDAITVTRKLGMQYLWVNSLCIVQDSMEDKIREIATMGDIYKSATVTIAAGKASKVGDGFLSDRPRPDICPIPVRLSPNFVGTAYLAKEEILRPLDDPLFRRGWAFQEFILGPRVMLYDSSRVTFPFKEQEMKGPQSSLIKYARSAKSILHSLVDDQSDVWKSLVEEYSARDFTFIEDRLPAIARIGKDLSEQLNGKYIVGFWRGFLVKHLGWYRRSGLSPSQRSSITGSSEPFTHLKERVCEPSWSWKSAPFAVNIDPCYEDAEVIGYRFDLASSEAPFGDVLKGTLTLRAKTLPFPEELLSKIPSGYSGKLIFDYESTKIDATVHVLFLGGGGGRSEKSTIGRRDIALIVQKLENDCFERIGFICGGTNSPTIYHLDWTHQTPFFRKVVIQTVCLQ